MESPRRVESQGTQSTGGIDFVAGVVGMEGNLSPALIIVLQRQCCLCAQANEEGKFNGSG
jgi:hypothetical protein